MRPVAVRILHREPASVGRFERALLDARAANAARLIQAFSAAGATDVREATPGDGGGPFGAAVRALVETVPEHGLVLLGSGALPLASVADLGRFVEAAASGARLALANNRYSADAIAIGRPEALRALPELPGDNALPRWLEEVAGFEVRDLRGRWRLGMDLDSPLDVLLVGEGVAREIDTRAVAAARDGVRAVARDRRGQLLVAGRTNAGALRWLERSTAARVRALVEERGLRASTPRALAREADGSLAPQRSPRSVLGMVLDVRGPQALGDVVADLADAGVIDTRVLLAHRLGADESAWPPPEDRFASDLLLPDAVRDPWLRALTAAARCAPVPILLGGHSLVGPGLRLALRKPPRHEPAP